MAPTDTLSDQLTRLRAEGTPEALQEATALEREHEKAHADGFDLGEESRKIDLTGADALEAAAAAPTEEVEVKEPPASDAARAKAAELGVDLSTVTPTGKSGAITVADVEKASK